MQALKRFPFQGMLAVALLKMSPTKNHCTFPWVLSDRPGSKCHRDKWSSTLVRCSPQLHKHPLSVYDIMGLKPTYTYARSGSMFPCRDPSCGSHLQGGKKGRAWRRNWINVSLSAHTEWVKTAVTVCRPQRRVRLSYKLPWNEYLQHTTTVEKQNRIYVC